MKARILSVDDPMDVVVKSRYTTAMLSLNRYFFFFLEMCYKLTDIMGRVAWFKPYKNS